MERAIDKIRSAHRVGRRKLELPMIGLTLYFGELTQDDMDGAFVQMREQVGEDAAHPAKSGDRNIYLLIAKAQLEDGSPAFMTGDLHYLRSECNWGTLQKMITFMFESGAKGLEEGKGELEPTTGSDGVSTSPTTGDAPSST